MLKLTDVEIKIMDHFHIVPNNFNGDGTLPTPEEVLAWALESPDGMAIRTAEDAGRLLKSLGEKLWDRFEDDSISIENAATWVLSHYFTLEQLRKMKPEEAESFLKDWKYHFGFRKCDGWGGYYIEDAIDALEGRLVLSEDEKEYWYVYSND